MLLEKIEAAGIKLAAVDDGLQITGEITDKQLSYLRLHKAELMAELKALSDPECHMWSYLLEIYGKPVTMLHLRNEPKEITTKTEDGRILITTADGSYLWKLGEGCDFIARGQDDYQSFPNLETARAWVKQNKAEK